METSSLLTSFHRAWCSYAGCWEENLSMGFPSSGAYHTTLEVKGAHRRNRSRNGMGVIGPKEEEPINAG